MSSSKGSLSPHEVLRVAVADESTFSFEESSGGPVSVEVISSNRFIIPHSASPPTTQVS